jgi:hypothetical protein
MAGTGKFIVAWRNTGGAELANTQSVINALCHPRLTNVGLARRLQDGRYAA